MNLKTAVRTEFEVKPKRDDAAWLPARLSRISALPSRDSPETATARLVAHALTCAFISHRRKLLETNVAHALLRAVSRLSRQLASGQHGRPRAPPSSIRQPPGAKLLRAAPALLPTLGAIPQRLVSRESRHGTLRACATSDSDAKVKLAACLKGGGIRPPRAFSRFGDNCFPHKACLYV